MKKKKATGARTRNKSASQDNRKFFNMQFMILVLSLIPLFFAAFFQGGYFKWEIYASLLLAIPAISLFIFEKLRGDGKLRRSGADSGLLIYLFVAFISLFFTVYFHATLTEFYKVLLYITMFYIILDTTIDNFSFEFVLNLLLILGAILSLIGITAYAGYKLNLQSGIFGFMKKNGFIEGYRLASTLQYANTFAAFLILPFIVGISFFIREKRKLFKVLYLGSILLISVALVLTQSRGGLIALTVSLIVYIILLAPEDRKNFLLIAGVTVALMVVIVLLKRSVFLPILSSFKERMIVLFQFIKGNRTHSLGTRTLMVKDSLKILKEHPLFGTGNGTFQYVYMKYRSAYYFSKFPHSIFFQVLDELGIVGGVSFVYLMFLLVKKGFFTLKAKRNILYVGLFSSAIGILLHALMDFDWSLMFMPLLFFVSFALLLSRSEEHKFVTLYDLKTRLLRRENKENKRHRVHKSDVANKQIRGATVAIVTALVLLFVFMFPFLAARADQEAKVLSNSFTDKKLALLQSATNFDPICAEYHYDLAHFYSKILLPVTRNTNKITEYVSRAENEYKLAIHYCPDFFLYHYELAELYLQTNNKKAVDEFEKAVSLNPIDPGGHAALGFAILQLENEPQLARIQFQEALKLDPRNSDAHLGMGRLYEKLGEKSQAISEYELAIKYNKKSAYAYYRLGVLLEEAGKKGEAIRDLFYAVYYNPNLFEAQKAFEKISTFVRVTNPAPGKEFKAGDKITIEWKVTNPKVAEYYEVYLYKNDKKVAFLCKTPKTEASCMLPQSLQPGKYVIRVYAINNKIMKSLPEKWVSFGEGLINVTK